VRFPFACLLCLKFKGRLPIPVAVHVLESNRLATLEAGEALRHLSDFHANHIQRLVEFVAYPAATDPFGSRVVRTCPNLWIRMTCGREVAVVQDREVVGIIVVRVKHIANARWMQRHWHSRVAFHVQSELPYIPMVFNGREIDDAPLGWQSGFRLQKYAPFGIESRDLVDGVWDAAHRRRLCKAVALPFQVGVKLNAGTVVILGAF